MRCGILFVCEGRFHASPPPTYPNRRHRKSKAIMKIAPKLRGDIGTPVVAEDGYVSYLKFADEILSEREYSHHLYQGYTTGVFTRPPREGIANRKYLVSIGRLRKVK